MSGMLSISASVGDGGVNLPGDVRTVQGLLNKFTGQAGFAPLAMDGKCGPMTKAAIRAFQGTVMGTGTPDGKVDPGFRTIKALNGTPSVAPTAPAPGSPAAPVLPAPGNGPTHDPDNFYPGRITGPVTGVKREIVNVLMEVSAFYRSYPIRVTSGLRTAREQGETMWKYWVTNLKRGAIYDHLTNNPALLLELQGLFNTGQREAFIQKVIPIAGRLSRHLTGGAVDIDKATDPKILAAIGTILRVYDEALCWHLDEKGRPNAPVAIPPQVKAGWAW